MTATEFIDQDGVVLKLAPAPNHGTLLTLTDKTSVSIVLTPGIALASSKLIVDSTGLSDEEKKKARRLKKVKHNKYGRAGSAEPPVGDYTDKAGTTILIYPDKDNRVLIEVAGEHDTLYFSVAPWQALDLLDAIRAQTGYTGEQLVMSAIREGLVDPLPPTERHDIKRDQKLRKKNPAYARLIAKLEGKAPHTGEAFHKKPALKPRPAPLSMLTIAVPHPLPERKAA